ncbi:MAG: tRNA epoxyqueuosine(34) reductase QueG, partial [Chloroflexi bacterium]|nr:tRNA epoxyqueuosine(34) reductase QueG [Chloroflexota bacterium]
GSFVFLGVLAIDLPLPADEPLRKSCGHCQRCLPACPTGAIVRPYVIDNSRCLSYLTIELKGPIPRELRPLVGDRLFGCDLCQDVCPVNRRAPERADPDLRVGATVAGELDLVDLLSLDAGEFRRRFRHTALWRTKRRGILRNAAVVLGNLGDARALPALVRALADPEPLVRGHVAWALGRLGGPEARSALEAALETEADDWVREEIELACGPVLDSSPAPA